MFCTTQQEILGDVPEKNNLRLETFFSTFNAIVDKLEREMRKYKEVYTIKFFLSVYMYVSVEIFEIGQTSKTPGHLGKMLYFDFSRANQIMADVFQAKLLKL